MIKASAFLSRHWAILLSPALAGALAALVMELWRARAAVPFTGYASDGLLNLALVKGVLENGWFQENPSVAAPFGQEFYDFSVFSGDNLHFALIKLIGLGSDDPSLVLNVFLLVSFPLTALTAVLVFRRLGLSNGTAVVCSVLFALLPYHFIRGINGHIFLAAYYAVPLGFYLTNSILSGEPLLARAPDQRGLRAYLTRRSAGTIAMAFVIAGTGIYYAFFTLILLGVAAAVAALTTRQLRPLSRAAGLIALLAALLLVNFSPNLIYRAANGANNEVGQRIPAESEAFATKLTHLLLPITNHRVDALADVTAEYEAAPVPPPAEYGVSLGAIGAIGFLTLLAVLLAGRFGPTSTGWRWRRLHEAAVIAIVTFLFVTVGGLSSLFAFELSPQIRAWYRLSIFIAFPALLAVGLILDAIRESPKSPGFVRRRFSVVLVLVLGVGVLDQTGKDFVPLYDAAETSFRTDRDFVRAIEARLPKDAEVFELPYVPFPESVLNRMDAYDPARGYIHSRDLEWSWGSMRGRDEDWQAALADDPPGQIARSVAAAGFEGLWNDRFGYADNGTAIESKLRRVLGEPTLVSADGRFAFFDLRRLRRQMVSRGPAGAVERLARSTLNPT